MAAENQITYDLESTNKRWITLINNHAPLRIERIWTAQYEHEKSQLDEIRKSLNLIADGQIGCHHLSVPNLVKERDDLERRILYRFKGRKRNLIRAIEKNGSANAAKRYPEIWNLFIVQIVRQVTATNARANPESTAATKGVDESQSHPHMKSIPARYDANASLPQPAQVSPSGSLPDAPHQSRRIAIKDLLNDDRTGGVCLHSWGWECNNCF